MKDRTHLLFAAGLGCFLASPAAAEVADAAVSVETASITLDPSGTSAESVQAAQPASPPVPESGWEVSVTPYLWASATKVDIDTPRGEHVSVDKSFTDILDVLKFAFMGTFEARRGRFVTVHDVMYLSIGSSADGNIGPVPLTAKVDAKLLTTAHLAGYRVLDKGPMFLDLFAGARITTTKFDLKLRGPFQTHNEGSKDTEIGPLIASRFRAPLGGRWGVAIYGDLGGFGVTSDLSWQLLGSVQYQLSGHWRLAAGWRHFHAEQKENGFKGDMSLDGPIMGATYRF